MTVREVAERYGLRANRILEWRHLAEHGKLVMLMAAILAHREVAPLLWDEHFSVDG